MKNKNATIGFGSKEIKDSFPSKNGCHLEFYWLNSFLKQKGKI
jgi:hypothetical protein